MSTPTVTPPSVASRSTAQPEAAIETKSSGPPPALRQALIIGGAIALVFALFFGVKWVLYSSSHETTDDAIVDADEVQVTSKITERVDNIPVDTNQPVKKGQLILALDNRDESDRVAQAQAAVTAQRAVAQAAEVNVSVVRDTWHAQNQENSGAIAAAQAAVQSASAQSASAQQQIDVAQAGVGAAQAQLTAAQSAVPGAKAALDKAQADFNRTSTLVRSGDVAQNQLDAMRASLQNALSGYSEAQANVTAAQANLAAAVQKLGAQRSSTLSSAAQVGVQQAQVTTAQGKYAEGDLPSKVAAQQAQADAQVAQVQSLEAQLATARDNLAYTRIVAPIDGYVGQKNVEVGQTVAPGEALITLIPATGTYITANFKETQIGKMRVGQEVDINIDAYNGVKFVGHVDNLAPASQNKFSLVPAQNATGNFVKVTQRLPVRILVDRVDGGNLADYALRPGMSVETSVKVK